MSTPRMRLGSWGEQVAGRFLQDQGYQIVSTNYRCAFGEVDIVAKEGEELVFVEVRTRRESSFVSPEESLSKHKLRRLSAACQVYLQQHSMESAQWRVDLVSIYLKPGQNRRVGRISQLRHVLEE